MSPTSTRHSRRDRAFALMLRAYPADHRARFEAGMRDALAEDHARASARSVWARLAFWTGTAIDAMRFGLALRVRALRQPSHHGAPNMRSLFAIDWRDALRSLRATPVVTAVAVLSLALGIGANTAMFSILNSLILKTLPVRDPARLVVVDDGSWTNPIWEQIRDHRREIFDDAFAWNATRFDMSTHGETDYVTGQFASGGIFRVLGVEAVIGRTFTEVDDARNGGPDGPVAVISYGFWQRRFGGLPDVLGRQITLNRIAVTIIGVTPQQFRGLDVGRTADVTIPLNVRALMPGGERALDGRATWWLEIMGRLRPGETLEQAQTVLRGLQPGIREAARPQNWNAKDLATFLPPSRPFTLIPASTGESELRRTYGMPLETIMAVVGAVLLIACANIANLLLARASARRGELGIRLALGASRLRLARQLLVESLLLSVAGAGLGLLIATCGSGLLVRQLSTGVTLDLSLDSRVLLFTIGVAVVTAMVFGLAPAIGVRWVAPNEALKAEGRGIAGDSRYGLKNLLVIGQVALSLALVVGAALFLRTLSALVTSPTGFDTDRLSTINVLAPSSIAPTARVAFFDRVAEGLAAVPGVASASVSALTPLGGAGWNTIIEFAASKALPPGRESLSNVNVVEPGWFKTYGLRILGGRDVDAHDVHGGPRVMVVSESFARKFFPGQDAVGQEVRAGIEGQEVRSYQIVGVVNDSLYRSVRRGFEPQLYLPIAQIDSVSQGCVITVRAVSGDPAVLTPSLSRAITGVDGTAAFTIRPIADQLSTSLGQERLVATLGGFFGGLALLLAGLGLYGVTSYSVSRRRGEIGIRMALGANAAGVVRLVMGRVGWIVATGIVVGAGLSWWASTYVTAMLFGTGPRDPWVFAVAAAVLAGAGLVAGWLPARRASHIDPVRVLRES